jgi:hypothetical protein
MEAVQGAFTRAGMIQYQDYSKRTPEQLATDLNRAHDRIKSLLTTSDRHQSAIASLESYQRLTFWIQGAALTGLGGGLVVWLMFH